MLPECVRNAARLSRSRFFNVVLAKITLNKKCRVFNDHWNPNVICKLKGLRQNVCTWFQNRGLELLPLAIYHERCSNKAVGCTLKASVD